jgi:hypothetical protein
MLKLVSTHFLLNTSTFDDTSYSEPVNTIISSFFLPYGFVNIRVVSANSSNFKIMDITNNILKLSPDVKVQMRTVDNYDYIEKRRSPMILLIDSFNEFENIKHLLSVDNPKYYLVILCDGIFRNFTEVLKAFWKNSITDVNYMIKKNESYLIYTYFPFKEGSCGEKLEMELINTFNSKNKRWTYKQFYPSKVKNLHQCGLKIGVTLNTPFAMLHDQKFHGIDIEIMDEIARRYNFTNHYNGPFASIGVIYENGTSTGLLSSLWEHKNDIGIGLLSLQYERIKFIPATPFYISAATTLTMPPTLALTPLEKLLMPFDIFIWCLLISMYVGGICIITLSRLMSKNVYEFIVGKSVYHPILNMLIALVGGSQNILPKRTFSRFLLAKCLIFCLVMRGLYQGKLFDIMQKDIHEKEPKTIDELIERNYIFYAYDTLARRIQDAKIAKR